MKLKELMRVLQERVDKAAEAEAEASRTAAQIAEHENRGRKEAYSDVNELLKSLFVDFQIVKRPPKKVSKSAVDR